MTVMVMVMLMLMMRFDEVDLGPFPKLGFFRI